MNIVLYKAENLKFDRYGYALKEISMDYYYGENFLVYKFVDRQDNDNEIAIPSINEVVIKQKNILKIAIDLMHIFTDEKLTILSALPDELVANNKLVLAKQDKSKEYRNVLNKKITSYINEHAQSAVQA